MRKILQEFNFNTIKKIFHLNPNHKNLLRVYKAGVLWAESSK